MNASVMAYYGWHECTCRLAACELDGFGTGRGWGRKGGGEVTVVCGGGPCGGRSSGGGSTESRGGGGDEGWPLLQVVRMLSQEQRVRIWRRQWQGRAWQWGREGEGVAYALMRSGGGPTSPFVSAHFVPACVEGFTRQGDHEVGKRGDDVVTGARWCGQ